MKSLHVALVAILAGVMPAAAQDWPTKPVRMVVPFAAGATPDIIMRLIGERLQAKTKQSFVVDNRPGASGNLGTDAVAKAAPDGTTIGISLLGPLGLNTLLFAKMPYDPFKDLALVTRLTDMPSVLAVNADVPARTATELLALLKREPGKFNYGSIGNGSLSHLAMEAIALKTGTQLVHIPYGSSPQAVTALIRGDVQIVCLPAVSVMSQVQTGKVRALAVTSPKRSPLLPEIATLSEAGIDVDANAWNGLIAPAKTPEPLTAAIAREVNEALHDKSVREKLHGQYMEPIGTTPAEFKAFLEAEMRRWTPVVQAAKIMPN
jgi:tripartite-type tricarboxylate transporter receptor subunit TctC